ncbi:MAG: 16S rRNA processing protein RimM [Bdellovibrionales bacterium]|nr:16S rRNA processing protein RimM [Bdellovibrionales bacterium]
MAIENEKTNFYSVGRVKEAHGLRGELYVKLRSKRADWLEQIENVFLAKSEQGMEIKKFHLEKAKVHKEGLILKLKEISDRTQAEQCKGQFMLIPSSLLLTSDEKNYYFYEIQGFKVIDSKLGEVGVIKNFGSNGAQDLILVEGRFGEVDIPYIDEFIDKVDFKKREILMNLPEGLVELNVN